MIQGRAQGETVQFALRLPQALRDEMRERATRAGRSLNTHIVMILNEAAGSEFGDLTPAAGNAQQEGPAE